MTGKEQPAQILLMNKKIGGSISIARTLRTDTANWTDPNIQLIIVHTKQATGLGHSDWNHFPIGILNSVVGVPISRHNIDNRTGLNPQGPIVTTITESNE